MYLKTQCTPLVFHTILGPEYYVNPPRNNTNTNIDTNTNTNIDTDTNTNINSFSNTGLLQYLCRTCVLLVHTARS